MSETVTTEEALWQAVGANPTDQLPRLALADYLDEQHGESGGVVRCGKCGGCGGMKQMSADTHWMPSFEYFDGTPCPACSGTGYVPDGRADTAAALRATCDRVPWMNYVGHMIFGTPDGAWVWRQSNYQEHLADPNFITCELARHCTAVGHYPPRRYYHTAIDAIRDLCAAWVQVNRKGVPA